jgi:hypothetical protein
VITASDLPELPLKAKSLPRADKLNDMQFLVAELSNFLESKQKRAYSGFQLFRGHPI